MKDSKWFVLDNETIKKWNNPVHFIRNKGGIKGMEKTKKMFEQLKKQADKGSKCIRLLEQLINENLAPTERKPYLDALEYLVIGEESEEK